MNFYPPVSPIDRENRFDPLIRSASMRYGVPAEIIKAVAAEESSMNPQAFREEPAIADASRGLMQVLLRTARSLGYTDEAAGLFDPAVSIDVGTRLLRSNFDRLGNWWAAVAAYNVGPDLQPADKAAAYVGRVEAEAARWGVTLPTRGQLAAGAAGGLALLVLGLALWKAPEHRR